MGALAQAVHQAFSASPWRLARWVFVAAALVSLVLLVLERDMALAVAQRRWQLPPAPSVSVPTSYVEPYVRSVRSAPAREAHVAGGATVSGGGKLRILFLTHRFEYTSYMTRTFFFQYAAAQRHPHVEAELWGSGLPGYVDDQTLRDNLLRRYGSASHFDLIFLFGHALNWEVKELADRGEALVTIREFDCFDGRCADYLEWNSAGIFQISYMNDMHYYTDMSKRRVVLHSPHCADPAVFYKPAQLNDRERHGAELAGAVSKMYPLRARWLSLITSNRLPEASVYKHPGYYTVEYDEYMSSHHNRSWSAEDEADVRARERQVVDFAASLKRVKILLMDSSVYRYAFAKFVEGVMAGCLILSDIPSDQPELYRQLVIEVSPDMTDDALVQLYSYWISPDRDQERFEFVRRAQRLLFPEFTYDTSIDRLIDGVNLYRQQRYGLYYSGSHIHGCQAVNMLVSNAANDWCVPTQTTQNDL